MFLQAGGGGKGIRPIQQAPQQQQQQSQQTAQQQQSQQHQNQIPTHHQTQPSILTTQSTSNYQTHHQSSSQSNSNHQIHHGHQTQHQQSQLPQQQQQQQQQPPPPPSTHLTNIQGQQILPQPHHHQTATLQHPSHHHTAIPYYTYHLNQAPQPPPQLSNHQQQQQISNNGAAAAVQQLVIQAQGCSSNGSASSTSINSGNSSNGSNVLRQHATQQSNNNSIPTMYAPNSALLQSPTRGPAFMTPYIQQYPLQSAVITAAQYPNGQANNGTNGNGHNGHNNQNNGAGPPQAVYQMTQQPHVQYFHTSASGPTPTAPPHLHPGQQPFRGVLTSGHHAQRHKGPQGPTYLLPTGTGLYAMPGQCHTQRASLLPPPPDQAGGGNGNIPVGQLMQATTTPNGTTFMPAFCTGPMGMAHGGLAGPSQLMTTAGAPLGPSPLQTYAHLANIPLSGSSTSMSSMNEGGAPKPRPHAIPIIDPITHENILDPKPLHKSASVEVKPTSPELNKSSFPNTNNNAEGGDKPSSKWRDVSIGVSIPQTKTTAAVPPISPMPGGLSECKDKMDQQIQTDVKHEMRNIIKIEDPNVKKSETIEDVGDSCDSEMKTTFSKMTFYGDNDDAYLKDSEDEKLIVVLEEQKSFVFSSSQKPDGGEDSINMMEGENENVIPHFNDIKSINYSRANKSQKIIHDKGQQAFIPKHSEEQVPPPPSSRSHDRILIETNKEFTLSMEASSSTIVTPTETSSYMMPSTTILISHPATTTPTKFFYGRRNKQNAVDYENNCSNLNINNGNIQDSVSSGSFEPPSNTSHSSNSSAARNETETFVKPQSFSYNKQQQSQQQSNQKTNKNTPTTSGASSSTASTPTHRSSHQTSTDTSTAQTSNKSKRQRNKRAKEQKKNQTEANNHHQRESLQKQQNTSQRGSSYNNKNNSNNTTNSGNANYNSNRINKKAALSFIQNNPNIKNSTMTVTAAAFVPGTTNTKANQAAEINDENSSHKSSTNNSSLTLLSQSLQQQSPHQLRYSSNNSSSNRSSRCGTDSVNELDLRSNFSSENTTPSSHLTSPKKNNRHVRAQEIVAKYLTPTPTNTPDSVSYKTYASDDPNVQFLNSSSSTCEEDDESNARITPIRLSETAEVYFGNFPDVDEIKKSPKTEDDDNMELDVTITKIFESEKSKQFIADTVDCVPIPIPPQSLSNEHVIFRSAAAPSAKKITILKSNDKYDSESKQRDFSAAMQHHQSATVNSPPPPTSPSSPPPPPPSTTRPKFYRYSLRDLRVLASNPESCKPPMIHYKKDNCVSQLFGPRQQHHLPQTHASLSSISLQHLQQYQQISYNESLEFVSGKRRGGSGGDRLKKHEHHSGISAGGNISGLTSASGQHQRKMDIIRVHLSLKEEIKLSECENAWTPDTLRGKSLQRSLSSTASNDDLEAVLKKVRGVLNKLTPNNFDVLLKTMTSITMNTQEKMQQVMLLIFEKTVSEPNFAPTYAKFCKVLFQEIKAESKSLFSTLLITRIQHEFETNVNDADAKQKKLQPLIDKLEACNDPKERVELQAELEDQEYQFRRRAWGTVRFIGEMYKLQSLTSDRVLICIESLLKHGSEEKLEFMCKLLTTVGYLLEAATPEQVVHKTRIDDIFRRMQEIVHRSRNTRLQQNQSQGHAQPKISSRVRFMMQDVMDLRARHWDQQMRTINATVGPSAQQQQQQQQQRRNKDEKSSLQSNMEKQQQSRGFGSSNLGGNQNNQRQIRSILMQGNDYFMQKSSKQQNMQQQDQQKLNIDVNKLRFTRGDDATTNTTTLGNSSLYLWRTAGRASTSSCSLTTTVSTTSTQQSVSNSHSSSTTSSSSSYKRQSANKFDVLDRVSPTRSQMQLGNDTDDVCNDEQAKANESESESSQYTTKECERLINHLVEEVFDITASETSWQEEALSVWKRSNNKQQVALLHYLLIDYLHLGSVKRQQREACAKIFKHLLITENIFDKAVFDEAYAQFGEEFADLLVDVPEGWTYVFEFIGPILHADLLTFDDIWKSQWADDNCCKERFLKAFINYFTHEHGTNFMCDLWHQRYKLDRGQKFTFNEEQWRKFVSQNRFDYLLLEEKKPDDSVHESPCPVARDNNTNNVATTDAENDDDDNPSKHIEQICKLIRFDNGTDQALKYMINVPINNEFLRGLTETFCCDIATSGAADSEKENSLPIESPRNFELEIFRKKCLPVLRLCVHSNESLELGCLDAIFEIMLDNYEEHKANEMICSIFDMFCDTEFIPKHTFEKWYQTQSLVDDAIEAAGNSTANTRTDSNSQTDSNSNEPAVSKKEQQHPLPHQNNNKQEASELPNCPETADNNNPHKISAELHAYMQNLLKMWSKSNRQQFV